jgi:NAD+ synthase (glutamine-hydrolysing)
MPRLRLALAQTNPTVGDLEGNARQIVDAAHGARRAGADLVATGEMSLTGYPIEDLASRPGFLEAGRRAVQELARLLHAEGLGDLPVIVGHPDGPYEPRLLDTSNAPTAIAKNCASVLQGGRVVTTTAKYHLPNYSVFDEYRVFIPGDELLVVRVRGVDVALIICEDLWRDGGPVGRVMDAGAGLLLVINASPWIAGKDEVRLPLVTRRATENDTLVAYVNIVGGQDDLLFDGDSVVVDGGGTVVARAPQWREHLLVVDLDPEPSADRTLPAGIRRVDIAAPRYGEGDERAAAPAPDVAVLPGELEQLWEGLVTGLRDYVTKNGFRSVILGLSGGIDSAVCASIAADALGGSRVYGVSMPSQWSSDHSRSDADDVAERIGVNYTVEPIRDLVEPFERQLELTGLAAENVQARARALILMGLSNLHGHLVLTTGNKTELSVGYSTIYGDSVGGFAPIKDVPKTMVWELAKWRNAHAEAQGLRGPIPENSITKPPSAELRPGQVDEDTLPPYDVLDGILDAYITRALGAADVVALGYDESTVAEVTRLVDRSEWKRRQGAIGPKISGMAFGRDRRLPITYRPTGF